MKYVAMCRDECGDEFRVNDTVYEFPDFESGDEAMWDALCAWQDHLEAALQNEVSEECGRVWLEREHADLFRSMGYPDDWEC